MENDVYAVYPRTRTRRQEVTTVAVLAPGRALIAPCSTCQRSGRVDGYPCYDCEGTGFMVWKACPRCGDQGFRFVNSRNDREGCTCLACGASWRRDDEDWLAQRVPDELLSQAG